MRSVAKWLSLANLCECLEGSKLQEVGRATVFGLQEDRCRKLAASSLADAFLTVKRMRGDNDTVTVRMADELVMATPPASAGHTRRHQRG
jgi:hypothetical protein